jgi:hypothetical protein
MAATTMTSCEAVVHHDSIAKLAPCGARSLAQLSDDELLANTRRLVGRSNQLLAALLVHLSEVEVRGVHRTRSCASLYTYCIYELRFSEDAAARRSAAARFAKAFPALLDAVAAGELHLTGLLMIGPHLTPENHENVLGRAKFRTKKELTKLVRELNPLPEVPDRIEPLGPAPARRATSPTWEQMVTSWSPEVRELAPGARPADWANLIDGTPNAAERANDGRDPCRAGGGGRGGGHGNESRFEDVTSELCATNDEALPVGPAPMDLPPVAGPQHFQIQFGSTEEHVQLVERAKALLARTRPGVTLGELHLEAMKLLVASLEKRRFGGDDRPPKRAKTPSQLPSPSLTPTRTTLSANSDGSRPEAPHERRRRATSSEVDEPLRAEPRQRVTSSEIDAPPHSEPRRVTSSEMDEPSHGEARQRVTSSKIDALPRGETRRRGRYIPAAVRREVYRRDGACCAFVDARGQRCRETHYLELHHLQPFARNGAHLASNLTLRCVAHNALAAQRDFGPQLMAERRGSTRHEALAAQTRVKK